MPLPTAQASDDTTGGRASALREKQKRRSGDPAVKIGGSKLYAPRIQPTGPSLYPPGVVPLSLRLKVERDVLVAASAHDVPAESVLRRELGAVKAVSRECEGV
jgi:hypothetical protein